VGARRALVAFALLAAAAGCGGGEEEQATPLPAADGELKLASPQIKDGGAIPVELTCDGEGKAPTITWREVLGASEIVLYVRDTDADFVHWTAYGISAAGGSGLAPDGKFPTGTKYGTNSSGKTGWAPPCPPEGDDPHRYEFAMYALEEATGLPEGAEPGEVLAKLEGAVARGTFTGTYERTRSE
jgi:Raf kinase inhibitor-like YbhB/YbcL family protein